MRWTDLVWGVLVRMKLVELEWTVDDWRCRLDVDKVAIGWQVEIELCFNRRGRKRVA